jgi:hypothetical protein
MVLSSNFPNSDDTDPYMNIKGIAFNPSQSGSKSPSNNSHYTALQLSLLLFNLPSSRIIFYNLSSAFSSLAKLCAEINNKYLEFSG